MLEIWLPFFVIGAGAAWWYHVLRLRERVTAHARHLCERRGLQLLDDSVALHRLRIRWRHGTPSVIREYRFDTSLGGDDRRTASLILRGDRVVGASVPEGERLEGSAPAPISMRHHSPSPSASPADAGNNVVPITRIRRTLH